MNERILDILIAYIDARIAEKSEAAAQSSDGGLQESIRTRHIEEELRVQIRALG